MSFSSICSIKLDSLLVNQLRKSTCWLWLCPIFLATGTPKWTLWPGRISMQEWSVYTDRLPKRKQNFICFRCRFGNQYFRLVRTRDRTWVRRRRSWSIEWPRVYQAPEQLLGSRQTIRRPVCLAGSHTHRLIGLLVSDPYGLSRYKNVYVTGKRRYVRDKQTKI